MPRITIFDTTLRDGEQSPGSSMTTPEKLKMAHQLDALGVDVIEAGFPVSSSDDYEAVRKIASDVRRPTIAALARARSDDIEKAASALSAAVRPRIHVFLATSDVHLTHKLRMSRDECLERIDTAVRLARRYAEDVEFSPEDATRTDIDFLCEAFRVAANAGARTVNIPDTVGYTYPSEYRDIVRTLGSSVTGADDVVISVHCHNDLGLAVANSLAAVEAGARQIECTVNGIGERAGNASLEEVTMALSVRNDLLPYDTGIVTEEIYPASRLLTQITGIMPQPNKAIVGANAFAHEAGIHQDGMLKEQSTYEILRPEMVGIPGNRLVLGKHCGRHAVASRSRDLGYDLDDTTLERAYHEVIALADRQKRVDDDDFLAILTRLVGASHSNAYELVGLEVTCGSTRAVATVRITDSVFPTRQWEAEGDGPLDAVFSALTNLIDFEVGVSDIALDHAPPGQGSCTAVVSLSYDERQFTGRGRGTDVVRAAAVAYLDGINKVVRTTGMSANSVENVHDFWGV